LEKEALLVLNELWAKVSARERFIVYGSVAVVVGWLFGTLFGTHTYGGGSVAGISVPGVTVNYYAWGNAGLMDILALVAGIATLVVVYLKVAPNMNITWPMPVVQILLGLTAIATICGLLALVFQFSNNLPDTPVLMYVADVLVIAGGGFAAYNAYLDYTASKA
jgi:hypothetical protein